MSRAEVKVFTQVVSQAKGLLMAAGIEVKLGEMFIPGERSYLFLALKNVEMIEGEVMIIQKEEDTGDENG